MPTPSLAERLSRLIQRVSETMARREETPSYFRWIMEAGKALDAAHLAIGTNDTFAMSKAYNDLAELLPQKETT